MVNQKVRIIIEASHHRVFNYVADLRNDIFWRKEVNWVLLDEHFNVGSVAVECSFLSKRVPNYVHKLKCISYVTNCEITYQTLDQNRYYLSTNRSVTALAANTTEFTYDLTFNPSIAEHGLGFRIPKFIVSFITKQSMRKYVKMLKCKIEDDLLKKLSQ